MSVLDAFLRFCDDRCIDRSLISLERREGRGNCVILKQPCAEDDCLLRVPLSECLTDREEDGRANHVLLGLAHLLLKEDAKGSASAHAPYVQLLLDLTDLPHHFLAECGKFPGASGAFAQIRSDRNEQFVEKLCSVHPSLSRDKAAQAVELVNNRAIYCEKNKVCALVPLVDMLNHDARANATWSMDEGSVLLRARRALEAGEELTISYGDEPRTELFIAYGFFPSGDGPSQCVDLKVSLHPPEEQQYGSNASAQLRILDSGAVKYRSALSPLLAASRLYLQLGQSAPGGTDTEPRAEEALVARAIVRAARAEQSAWLQLLAGTESDRRERIAALVEANVASLLQLLGRVEPWLAGSREESLLSELSAAPVTTAEESSSDGSDAGSDAESDA
eukprot:TRINITY_DN672_c1_g1_i3.p1 TRINITY_DN672_c1_g1~~TRINITY_DN672_c1_g1_i3.p1  ORF type:complete len:392 (-),score=74.46 TRINITY_DN672_c1_g1_i3:39-1214(-)